MFSVLFFIDVSNVNCKSASIIETILTKLNILFTMSIVMTEFDRLGGLDMKYIPPNQPITNLVTTQNQNKTTFVFTNI